MSSFNYNIPESQVERPEGFQGSGSDVFVRDQEKDLEKMKSFRQAGELFLAKKHKHKDSQKPSDADQVRKSKEGSDIEEEGVSMFPGREGYKTDFLGIDYPMPTLGDSIKDKAAHLLDNPDETELKYNHFSIVMNAERRQCFFTACNIDGTQSQNVKRSGSWVIDGRIAREHQLGNEAYSDNSIDRGHMVRRLDPAWGSSARLGSSDTFVYTNSGLQCDGLNQKEWLALEDHVLSSARGQKMTVLTGPVLSENDRPFTNHGKINPPTQISDQFWKIVVWNDKQSGTLKGAAFVLSQSDILDRSDPGLFKGGFDPDRFDVYQVPISKIEELTDLHFAPCQDITSEATRLTAADNYTPQGL